MGNVPSSGTVWGGQNITTASDTDPVNRRKGSWLDGSPKAVDNASFKPLVARTQLSPRESPFSEPRSAKVEILDRVESKHDIDAAVAAVESRWRAKFEAASLDARNAKAALLEARSKINEQSDRILMLEAELSRLMRQSPQKPVSVDDNFVVEENASKGGVAFDIQLGDLSGPPRSKPSENTPQIRDRLMARLGMSASQRRMLAVVEPDAKLSRILQGDDALPSALPAGYQAPTLTNSNTYGGVAGIMPNKLNSPSPPNHGESLIKPGQQRMVTWQEEAGRGGGGDMKTPSRVPIYRTMSGRCFSDGKSGAKSAAALPRCATCGVTTGLEADEDNPGVYYCVTCWEEYENEDDEEAMPYEVTQPLKTSELLKLSSNPAESGVVPRPPMKSPIAVVRKTDAKSTMNPILSSPPVDSTLQLKKSKPAFAGRCFVLSDNTHLLNQVAILLSKGDQSNVTALVETKGAKGKVRLVAAQIVTVGCCHAVGSKGADLGTDVVVARTNASTEAGLIQLDGSRGSMFIELASMYAFEKDPEATQQETIGDFKGFRMNMSEGIPLDGRVIDKQWKSHAEKVLGSKIDDMSGEH
jgi:hypothetical protein